METVTFQCGSCNQLMAVSSEYLGQQVQCPHCQSVLLAPSSAEPTPPSEPAASDPAASEPAASEPAVENPEELTVGEETQAESPPMQIDTTDYEDIFTPPSEEDEVFGDGDPTPELTLPEQPAEFQDETIEHHASPPVNPDATDAELSEVPLMELAETETQTQEYMPPTNPVQSPVDVPAEPIQTPLDVNADPIQPPVDGGTAGESPMPWMQDDPTGTPDGEPTSPAQRRARGGGGGMLIPLLILPLVSYSILATVFLVILYNRYQSVQGEDLKWLEEMPDVNGDTPGVEGQPRSKKRTFRVPNSNVVNKIALPDNLRVALGKTLRIGHLEVEPLSVKRKRVKIFAEGAEVRPEPLEHDSLVLNVKLTNKSDKYSFAPIDSFFVRRFVGGRPPMTVLEAGKHGKFIGGPALWRDMDIPITRKRNPARREWVAGHRMIFPRLAPGESTTTFICTDGTAKLEDLVDKYKGEYLWRVWVRRGPVKVPGRNAPVPATTVIGVEFSASDISS